MASITPKLDKDGNVVAYKIKVFLGYSSSGKQMTSCKTWRVPANKSSKSVQRELNTVVAEFEAACKKGEVVDCRQRFDTYADKYIRVLERKNASQETIRDYKERLSRINPYIGYMKLSEIKATHLNDMYDKLMSDGARKDAERAYAAVDIKQVLKDNGLTMKQVCDTAKISDSTLRDAVHQKPLKVGTAKRIADAMGIDYKRIFDIMTNPMPLSNITVLGYHRVISSILSQAVKERIISDNPAKRATPPSASANHDPNYLQVEEVVKLLTVMQKEPLYWRVMIYLFVYSGARRGEILAIKWEDIDFDKKQISISKSVSASKDKHIYEHAPKTKASVRTKSIGDVVIDVLKEYRMWYESKCKEYGITLSADQYIFARLNDDYNGLPCHPSSVNHYLINLEKKYGLPHINPHAFRHTYASLLIYSNMNVVAVQRCMGHAKATTTMNMYAHMIGTPEEEAADVLSSMLTVKGNSSSI